MKIVEPAFGIIPINLTRPSPAADKKTKLSAKGSVLPPAAHGHFHLEHAREKYEAT